MKANPILLAVGGLLLGLAAPAIARQQSTEQSTIEQPPNQSSMPDTAGMPAGEAAGDEKFLSKAMKSGVSEVSAAQLAIRQSGNDDIEAFARKLANDHMAINQELARAADTELPRPEVGHKDKLAGLDSLSGEAFDRAWLQHMRKGHAKGIAMYERAARTSQSAEVRQLAEGTLPALRRHAATIDSLISRYGQGMSGDMRDDGMHDQGMHDEGADADPPTPAR